MVSPPARTILHLRHKKNCDSATKIKPAVTVSSLCRNDFDRKKDRIIEIRYRSGKVVDPVIMSTAVDMRKQFFSLVNVRDIH